MRILIFSAAVLALAACGQTVTPSETPAGETPAVTGPSTAEEATAQDTCGAAAYRSLVGTSIAAVTLPEGIRVIAPDTAYTEDFRADRINIRTDANGVITSVECF